MKKRSLLLFTLALPFFSGCAQFLSHRDYLMEMEHDNSTAYTPHEDFPVVAGDTGQVWESSQERRARTPASAQEVYRSRHHDFLEEELRQLESKQSESAMEFYSLYKDKLSTTSEKIYFLKLSHFERRDYLESRGFFDHKAPAYDPRERMFAVRHSQIILGMSKEEVVENWGQPSRVEVAGNPSYENERWLYQVNGATKYIYFESGRVGGWE